jgi:hypothetical protein
VLISDDDRKVETSGKFLVYGISTQIIVLTESRNDKKTTMLIFLKRDGNSNEQLKV